MRAALYLWRATAQRSWRTVLTVALIGGLFGAVALGAVAGARRTASAYERYLASIKASDAFVNVPARPCGVLTNNSRTLFVFTEHLLDLIKIRSGRHDGEPLSEHCKRREDVMQSHVLT